MPHLGQVGEEDGETENQGMGVLDGVRWGWKQANERCKDPSCERHTEQVFKRVGKQLRVPYP